jgi:hypothetical protein
VDLDGFEPSTSSMPFKIYKFTAPSAGTVPTLTYTIKGAP